MQTLGKHRVEDLFNKNKNTAAEICSSHKEGKAVTLRAFWPNDGGQPSASLTTRPQKRNRMLYTEVCMPFSKQLSYFVPLNHAMATGDDPRGGY